MSANLPTILIIVGISGDLAQRKLLPAIGKMAEAKALPDKFRIVGISRSGDLYVAKETVQNLIVFRQDNSLFKHTWNKDFIDNIQIIVSEEIGIEGRAVFYERTGALRDILQSHLLQLLSLVLMDSPKLEKSSS